MTATSGGLDIAEVPCPCGSGKKVKQCHGRITATRSQVAARLGLSATPVPGLYGDCSGPCIVCLRDTDSALDFKGQPEWVIAAIIQLGLPLGRAEKTLQVGMGWPVGMVPDAENVEVGLQVCQSCAKAHGFVARVPPDAPLYVQPASARQPIE